MNFGSARLGVKIERRENGYFVGSTLDGAFILWPAGPFDTLEEAEKWKQHIYRTFLMTPADPEERPKYVS